LSDTLELDDKYFGLRLDKALAQALPSLSRERIKALLSEGRITRIDGACLPNPSKKIDVALQIKVDIPPPLPTHNVGEAMDLSIAYEDDDLIVVDKPAGLVVHPAAGNAQGTLVNALLHHCEGQLSGIGGVARPGIVHRIDKGTSGLIVVAKHDRAHIGLAQQFADHSIYRRYIALVHGHPNPRAGTVNAAMARSQHNRKKMSVVPENAGKHAITHYHIEHTLRDVSQIMCRLETGRTHQIRVHMAHIGHHLLGDPVYGRSRKGITTLLQSIGFERQALHAAELGFIHPVNGKEIRLSSALPADMLGLIDALRL
jgi:23S rRNA pseudouridine1911/1915/1917 synthase